MADIYVSGYTGLEVDDAVRDKVETISYARFSELTPSLVPTAKIYIITDGGEGYANTMWRSNGTNMVPLSGGGGGGGGTSVGPITRDEGLEGRSRLYGITISGTAYRITNVGLSSSTGTDITLIIK